MDTVRQDEPVSQAESGQPEPAAARTLIVERSLAGPVHGVFEAWTRPDLFRLWWVPKSLGITLVSHEADVRTGGSYRLVMAHPSVEQPMAFFGRYLDVTAPLRVVWTNDEGGEGGAVTTVHFEEDGEATRVIVQELYPSRSALEEALASGEACGWDEQLDQLDELVGHLTSRS